MKERYQDIDEKNEALNGYIKSLPNLGKAFLERFEMSWIYHDNALEGVIYTPQELSVAIAPNVATPEASLMPVLLEVRNHKAAIEYLYEDAKSHNRKQAAVSMAVIKRVHDLLAGSTPEALALRAATERRERTEKELAKERERSGLRKDMPLHRTYFHDIAQPSKIQGLLEKLVDFTGTSEFREYHPIQQAAVFHHQFMQVFPFAEHSGRTGRLLANLVLMRAGYRPGIIHSVDRQRYYETLKGSPAAFRGLLLEALSNSLENGVKFFRENARRT